MKKMLSTLIATSAILTSSYAMEFGTMGSQSFGMAGAGVAVKESPWGLYYNPALIAVDDGFKFGLFVEAHSKSKNFWDILNSNFENPSLEDINKIKNFVEDNRISLGSQDGAVIQLPDFGIGALAVGGFFNASANGMVKGDFSQIQTQQANQTNKNLNLETNFSALALLEIPVGYAYEFDTDAGDISIGLAVKYMNLSGTVGNFKLADGMGVSDSFKNLLKVDFGHNASNVGVDLGLSYEIADLFTLGVVGKNLNAPSFDLGAQKIKIDPQARAGVALDIGFWTLALDADLTANKFLGTDIKNQMISVGTALDFKFFSLRGGIATDLQNKDDLIFALGVGFTFFDFGVQFGKKTNPLNGMPMPDYLALQLGAGFSF